MFRHQLETLSGISINTVNGKNLKNAIKFFSAVTTEKGLYKVVSDNKKTLVIFR